MRFLTGPETENKLPDYEAPELTLLQLKNPDVIACSTIVEEDYDGGNDTPVIRL